MLAVLKVRDTSKPRVPTRYLGVESSFVLFSSAPFLPSSAFGFSPLGVAHSFLSDKRLIDDHVTTIGDAALVPLSPQSRRVFLLMTSRLATGCVR